MSISIGYTAEVFSIPGSSYGLKIYTTLNPNFPMFFRPDEATNMVFDNGLIQGVLEDIVKGIKERMKVNNGNSG